MLKFLKQWTLPIAMIIGAAGWRYIGELSAVSPVLIFLMLLLTFNKLSVKELKLRPQHLWLLLIEIGGAVLFFMLMRPVDLVAAEGVLVCMICPTATAAAVVTGKLKGSVASITTYTLLCNIVVAVAVPVLFPLLAPQAGHASFAEAFLTIISKIFPLLICPFLAAQLIRGLAPRLSRKMADVSGLAFYLWAVALTIAMGITVKSLIETEMDGMTLLWLTVGAAVAAVVQFGLGKVIGARYDDKIASGQSLGQKNTILAIWMCHTYLNPLSAIGPGIYIIFQNLFNSYQLYKMKDGV